MLQCVIFSSYCLTVSDLYDIFAIIKKRTMKDTNITLSQEFLDSISALNDAIVMQQNSAAACLYRLMFRHERNIDILDHYADQILEGISGMGSEFAEEDYRNFLQYLNIVAPSELEEHKKMYEEQKRIALDDEEYDLL